MFVQIGALRPLALAAVSGCFPGTGGPFRTENPCKFGLSEPCPDSCFFLLLPRSVRMRHGGRDLCSGEPPLTPPLNSGAVTDNCKQLRVSNDPPSCGSGSAVPAGPGSHHCESRRPEVCQTPLTAFLPYRPDALRYDR